MGDLGGSKLCGLRHPQMLKPELVDVDLYGGREDRFLEAEAQCLVQQFFWCGIERGQTEIMPVGSFKDLGGLGGYQWFLTNPQSCQSIHFPVVSTVQVTWGDDEYGVDGDRLAVGQRGHVLNFFNVRHQHSALGSEAAGFIKRVRNVNLDDEPWQVLRKTCR